MAGQPGPAIAAGVPLAAAADFINGWTPSGSDTEMILTFSVTDGTSVRLRESKVYYIADGDADLYQAGGGSAGQKNNALLSSNWYADNPHSVDREVKAEANQFNLMIDTEHGPLHTIAEATQAAAAHCGTVGRSQVKFISEAYPGNDRSTVVTRFECQ